MDLFVKDYGLKTQIKNILNSIDIKNKHILNVGCGSGWLEKYLNKKGIGKSVGIDISDDVLSEARKKTLKNSQFVKSSALDIPYKKNFFDVVLSFEVIEHIPSEQEDAMFFELYRVLKPGGTLVLSTPYSNIINVILDPAWWLKGHRHYSSNKIINYASKAGFKSIEISRKGAIFTIALLNILYISKWIIRVKPPFYSWLVKRSRNEYKRNFNGFVNLFLICRK